MLSEADSDFALFAWSLSACVPECQPLVIGGACLEWLVLKKREKQTKKAVNSKSLANLGSTYTRGCLAQSDLCD